MKVFILLFLFLSTSAYACSPPMDGSHFTCPSNDFFFQKPVKKQFIQEPVYKKPFGYKAQQLVKKIKDYELRHNIKLVEKMIDKALVEYEK